MNFKKGDKVIRIMPCEIASLSVGQVYTISKVLLGGWILLEGFDDIEFGDDAFTLFQPKIITNWKEVLR